MNPTAGARVPSTADQKERYIFAPRVGNQKQCSPPRRFPEPAPLSWWCDENSSACWRVCPV